MRLGRELVWLEGSVCFWRADRLTFTSTWLNKDCALSILKVRLNVSSAKVVEIRKHGPYHDPVKDRGVLISSSPDKSNTGNQQRQRIR